MKEFTEEQVVAHLKQQQSQEKYRHSDMFIKKQKERCKKKALKAKSVRRFLTEHRDEVENSMLEYVREAII